MPILGSIVVLLAIANAVAVCVVVLISSVMDKIKQATIS